MTIENAKHFPDSGLAFDIERDDIGVYRQVWVHQSVAETESLELLQSGLAESIPGFTPIGPRHLHVTLVHIGRPHELYTEILEAVPQTNPGDFIRSYNTLLEACEDAVPVATTVEIEGLTLLSTGNVVALDIAKTAALLEKRAKISTGLHTFIQSFGIQDAEGFMLQSPSLRLEPDSVYRPHITLGRSLVRPVLPRLLLPKNIRLAPSHMKNAKKKG